MFKANQQTGELTTSFSQQEWIGLIPAIGGLINSGINYDDRGRQRGGWKWNPRAAGAATVSGVAGAALSIYGTPVGEYINQQMYGEEHSNYASLGVNKGFGSFISAAGGAIAAAFAMEASNADFDQGESVSLEDLDIAEGANKMGQTHSGAGIFQGAGYSIGLRRYGHYLQRQLTGVGMGVVDGNGFTGVGASLKSLAGTAANGLLGVFSTLGSVTGVTERLGNFFSEDFNGDRWNFESDQQQNERGISTMNQLAQAGDVEGAKALVSRLGLSPDQANRLHNEIDLYYERDVSFGQAAYEVREVAHQFGVAKDGEGILYREAQNELRKIVGDNGKASPADILEAGKRAAESLGYNTSGKSIDWAKVSQGRSSAITADLNNRTETTPLNTSGIVMNPLFQRADGSFQAGGAVPNVGVGNFLTDARRASESAAAMEMRVLQDRMYLQGYLSARPGVDLSVQRAGLSADPNAFMRGFVSRPEVANAGISPLFRRQAQAFPEVMFVTNSLIGVTAASAATGGYAGAAAEKATSAALLSASRATQLAGSLAGRVAWESLTAEVLLGAGANTLNTVMQAGMARQPIDGSTVAWSALEGAALGVTTYGFGRLAPGLTSPFSGRSLNSAQQAVVFGSLVGSYDITKQVLNKGLHSANPWQSLTAGALTAGAYYTGGKILGSASSPVTRGDQLLYSTANTTFWILPTITAHRAAYNIWNVE